MAKIERNPVPNAKMKVPIACIDFDASGKITGTGECALKRRDAPAGKKEMFECPNHGQGEGNCLAGAFTYPRRKRADGTFHFHQGIDLTPEPRLFGDNAKPGKLKSSEFPDEKRARIHAVIGGTVAHAKFNNSYGNLVVIKSDESPPRYYLYAHCHSLLVQKGDRVQEFDQIAIVGRSGINTPTIPDHLHFEVTFREPPLPSGAADQTKLGDSEGPRLDPLKVLEALGPWGMTEVYLPHRDKAIEKNVAEIVEQVHELVEHSGRGGYFPLGANNTWHGGVHLPVSGMVPRCQRSCRLNRVA